MKLIKTVKKIMALSTGAIMVGATVLSATAAADLATYPVPFVKDGKFNGIIVVGDSANAADVLGSVDVATSLQFASRTKKTIQSNAAAQVSVDGEAWRVGTSSKKLEMSEKGTGVNETIRDITTFITEDELPSLLADGTHRNAKGDFSYHQYLYFDDVNNLGNDPASRTVIYDKSTNDANRNEIGDFFYVKNGDQIARYSLEFTTSAESDITDSSGTASTTGTYLWSMEGKDIVMLGKTFSMVKARRSSSVGNGVELTLMGGAVQDTMDEGESKTYTIGGKDFVVTLDFVGTSTAKFIVNGEISDSLQEGDTYTLADKSLVGVKDISVQDFQGGVRKAEFYVGADKIVLKDTAISDGVSSDNLKVGSETIDDTEVIITGSDDNTTFKIDKIQLNVTADSKLFVPPGGRASSQLDEPGAFLGVWDIEYNGLEIVPTTPIRLNPSSDQYFLEFTDGDGNAVKLPFIWTDSNNNVQFGEVNSDSSGDLIFDENATIDVDDYLIVTDESQKQGARSTHVFQYTKGNKFSADKKVIMFKKLGSSGTIERPVTVSPSAGFTVGTSTTNIADLQAGGATFKIWNVSTGVNADYQIRIDLNGDGTLAGSNASGANGDQGDTINITTKAGAQIGWRVADGAKQAATYNNSWPYPNAGGVIVSIKTPDSDAYDNKQPSFVEFNVTATSGEIRAAEYTGTVNYDYKNPQGDTTLKYVYTSMGALVTFESPTSDPQVITMDYPSVQALPLLYVVAPSASIKSGEASEGGQIVYYETTPIAVGSAKLAGEVADITAQNAIVVGGPCANAAASELMGNPANCAEGFSAGKAMVKLFEAKGNVAMLVAGASASDTRRAARVVANYQQWQDAGKLAGLEVEVSGTSFTDISVAAPVVKEVMEEVVVADDAAAADNTTTVTG